MAEVPCASCQRPIDDQAVLCPYCGAAQIPQMTKTELSRQIGRMTGRGFAYKIVVTVTLLEVVLLVVPRLLWRWTDLGESVPWLPDVADVLAVLVILGGVVWIYLHHRKVSKRSFGKPDDPAPALPMQFPQEKGRRGRQDR